MPWDRTRPKSPEYGPEHVKARKRAAAVHRAEDPCYRCGLALGPMRPTLHLDHYDDRSRGYAGFSHRSCNEAAAARKANARRKAARLGQASDVTRLRW